tara:strand:+ start:4255 stop:5538 length:1284 start_codon:yes stop_codon:yes gene_type:complete
MNVNQFNTNNLDRLGKIQKYLVENYDINVGKVLPQKKLDKAYRAVEQRIANLRNKGSKFQQDPNYGMNIMVRDALGIMITEGLYYEGENYRKLMDELYEYSCSLAESGDDYDTVMASAGKKYDVMPARYPKEMVLAALAEQLKPMYEIAPAVAGAMRAGAMGFGAGAGAGLTGGSVNLESEINELENPPVEDNPLKYLDKEGNYENEVDRKFAYIMGKALGKQDYFNFSLSELFAELESIDVKMADALEQEYIKHAKAQGEKPMSFKESKQPSSFDIFLDEVVDSMVTEEIAGTSVEEAEVVMAARALSNDIQDHIERIGRMVNEDLPAISDSMAHEFGVEKARSFKDGMEQLLSSTLEANKAAKEGIDGILSGITGEGEMGGGMMDEPADDMMAEPALDDVPLDDFDGADAEAGPIDEPLGRAEKE